MTKTIKTIVTLLPGETLNTTIGEYSALDVSIGIVHIDDIGSTRFSARTKGNAIGEKRDRSTTGIFVPANDTFTVPALSAIVFGPFDVIYNATTSRPMRCEIVLGAG